MKKLQLIILVIFTMSVATKAQEYFTGGSLSFATSSSKAGGDSKGSETSFNFSPEIGKIFSDKIWAGVKLGVGYGNDNDGASPEVVKNSTKFGVTPFVRYYAIRMNKFAISAQGELGFGYSTSKTKTGGNSADGPKYTNVGFNVYPYITYDISNKVILQAKVNGLNFGLNHKLSKSGDVKNSSTGFGFGVNSNNLLEVGALTIGAAIKF